MFLEEFPFSFLPLKLTLCHKPQGEPLVEQIGCRCRQQPLCSVQGTDPREVIQPKISRYLTPCESVSAEDTTIYLDFFSRNQVQS